MAKKQESLTDSINQQMQRLAAGRPVTDNRIHIALPHAEHILQRGLVHFLGKDAQWLPEYHQIVEWLTDNKKKGLLCYGNCGRGKTLITQHIIPIVLAYYYRLVVNTHTALELNENYKDIVWKKIISIDDVGTEPEANDYGVRHRYFAELVDECERKEKLLIVSTNLTGDELLERYGERTIDRLFALTNQVLFKGNSLRK